MKKNLLLCMVLALSFAMVSMMPLAAFADGGTGAGGGGGKNKGDGSGKGGGGKIGLSIESSMPADGETGVALMTEIRCAFTHNVIAGKLAEKNLALLSLETADGTKVETDVWVGDEQVDPELRTQLFMKPKADLEPGKTYTVRVAAGLEAKNGMVTKEDETFTFTTAEKVVPAEPTEAPAEPAETEAPAEVPTETPAAAGIPGGVWILLGLLVLIILAFVAISQAKKNKKKEEPRNSAKPAKTVKVEKKNKK